MAGLEVLVETIGKASSQDPAVVKLAEEKIKEWETDSNFYKALLNISCNGSLALNVRWMSTIFFKNGIDKYWRRTLNRIFSEEDKNFVKQVLISSFSEPINQIFVQKAIVIGRIARTDLRSWPALIPCLLQEVRSKNKTIQYNALLTLNHVIKSLASKRLAIDRRTFKQVSTGLLSFVLDLWRFYTDDYIQHLSTNEVHSAENGLRVSLLTLKVLRKLVVEGNDETVEEHSQILLKTLIEKMPILLRLSFTNWCVRISCQASVAKAIMTISSPMLAVCYPLAEALIAYEQSYSPKAMEIAAGLQNVRAQNIADKLEKIIATSMKILLDVQNRHPFLFVNMLEDALNLAIGYVFSCPEQDLLYEMFLVQCANLIKAIVKTAVYKSSKTSETGTTADAAMLRAEQIKQRILTQDVIAKMCEQLVVKYFPLKSKDLNEWENFPEDYLSEEVGESAEYLIRPCTENLFLCLFYEYRTTFTEVLSKLVQSLNTSYSGNSPECLLFREAVYFALGLASYELFGDFDFDRYFKDNLLNELQNSSNGMKIVHRRVLWLIGRWINVSFSKESRNILYQIIVEVLDRKEDLVVRVTAARALKDAVDDYQFESKDVSRYLKPLWENLFRLLVDVKECDTKMGILNTISMLIERTGREMQPYAAELCDYLPHLWADSADHNMLRCVMVVTLCRVVEALGVESMRLHPLLLPIIQLSTDLKQAAHVYLLDDGLDLWLTLMQNSNVLTEECLAAFAILPVLLEQTSENFKTCIAIMESYILIDALSVIKIHSTSLISVIDCLMGQLKDEGNILLSELVKIILISLPNEGAIVLQNILAKIFKIIIEDQEYPRVIISYLSLFGYIMLQNPAAFQNVLQKCSLDINEEPETLAAKLIDVWLDKVDCMSDDKTRKLTALVLVSLLPSNAPFVNERFALILDAVVNVLYDESQRQPSDPTPEYEKEPSDGENNLGEERKRKCRLADIASSVDLLGFVKSKLEESRISFGGTNFHLLMETLDPVVTKQLMSLIA